MVLFPEGYLYNRSNYTESYMGCLRLARVSPQILSKEFVALKLMELEEGKVPLKERLEPELFYSPTALLLDKRKGASLA